LAQIPARGPGAGQKLADLHRRQGELISDFYAYNACIHQGQIQTGYLAPSAQARMAGLHWVGDLAVECELEVRGDDGEVWLDLVEGGRHYQCRFDVAEGTATLMIDGGQVPFAGQQGEQPPYALSQKTKLHGAGSYTLRFANADDQLLLWVNGRLIDFPMPQGGPAAAYEGRAHVRPEWSPQDPGDLAPVGIGAKGVAVEASHLRVLRDVYYIATKDTPSGEPSVDYEFPPSPTQWLAEIDRVFHSPGLWATTQLFDLRRHVDFPLAEDQFFPMGDNSPQSKDARLWWTDFGEPEVGSFVERKLLTGKAFLIYWPHPWYAGTRLLPIVPNVSRMGLIR
jgi:hypothetical protein